MNTMTTFDPFLKKFEGELQGFVKHATHKPEYLYNMIQYHMGWVNQDFLSIEGHIGKRLRPLFLLLCCDALSDEWESALPAAVAVELLHNFTTLNRKQKKPDTNPVFSFKTKIYFFFSFSSDF